MCRANVGPELIIDRLESSADSASSRVGFFFLDQDLRSHLNFIKVSLRSFVPNKKWPSENPKKGSGGCCLPSMIFFLLSSFQSWCVRVLAAD